MRKGRFSVYLVGQRRKYCGETGVEDWNGQCLRPRREGLESLIQEKWQELSIRRQCRRRKQEM